MKNKKLLELKKQIEDIEITYDFEETYTNLINTTIDYQNDTQDWSFEYVFEDYIDEEILKDWVKYKIDNEGLWSVVNLLSDINRYEGIYYIDAYQYGHDIDKSNLECIKDEILQTINDKLEEEEEDD